MLLADRSVGTGGQRHDLIVIFLNNFRLDYGYPLATLAHLRGRAERPRLAGFHVVDGYLDREGLLVFFGYRVQCFGHSDVDQGRDDAPVDGAAGVEVPILGLQPHPGATVLGARYLGSYQLRKAFVVLRHRCYLTLARRFLSPRMTGKSDPKLMFW